MSLQAVTPVHIETVLSPENPSIGALQCAVDKRRLP